VWRKSAEVGDADSAFSSVKIDFLVSGDHSFTSPFADTDTTRFLTGCARRHQTASKFSASTSPELIFGSYGVYVGELAAGILHIRIDPSVPPV